MSTNKSAKEVMPVSQKRSPFIPTIVGLSLVFLTIIGILFYQTNTKKLVIEQNIAELEDAYALQGELELQYNDAVAQLESLYNENEQMNSLIDEQKGELKKQKQKIRVLLKDSKQLKKVKEELKNMDLLVQDYLLQLQELLQENEELTIENDFLIEDRAALQEHLSLQMEENLHLNEAKAVLISQKEELDAKVHVASVIKVKDIEVVGVKTKPKGKIVSRKSAKGVDRLRVCFTAMGNEVVQPGIERFYARIINPAGETLAIEKLGSGHIQNQKSGEDIRYTKIAESEYINDEQDVCFFWEPGVAFHPGNYTVEIYNKGYLAGSGSFVLK